MPKKSSAAGRHVRELDWLTGHANARETSDMDDLNARIQWGEITRCTENPIGSAQAVVRANRSSAALTPSSEQNCLIVSVDLSGLASSPKQAARSNKDG